jgi:hypothetical protein
MERNKDSDDFQTVGAESRLKNQSLWKINRAWFQKALS